MKKLTYLIMTVVVVGLSARLAWAEGMKGPMAAEGMAGQGTMMGKGMMGAGMMDGGMMKMMHMMHGMMRSPSMVASNDGGVIVLAGNKLYKYDKSLNLVKEAEIKMDMDGGMMGMKKMCPMCAKMKGREDTADEAAEGEADQPAQEESEHKSHH